MTTHRFSVLDGGYAVVRRKPRDPVPQWATALNGFVSVTRTPDELSIVAPDDLVPASEHAERGWQVIRLHGPFAFEQIGVLASVAGPLAANDVSLLALSTFETDYVLVKTVQLERAVHALQAAGHVLHERPRASGRP